MGTVSSAARLPFSRLQGQLLLLQCSAHACWPSSMTTMPSLPSNGRWTALEYLELRDLPQLTGGLPSEWQDASFPAMETLIIG